MVLLFLDDLAIHKYAFFGALRSAAQFISYEIVIAVTIMSVIVCVRSLNFTTII